MHDGVTGKSSRNAHQRLPLLSGSDEAEVVGQLYSLARLAQVTQGVSSAARGCLINVTDIQKLIGGDAEESGNGD